MKVLFLDIDGVLNCRYTRLGEGSDTLKTAGGLVSKSRIELLNTITDKTGAVLVLSSTWRHDDGIKLTLKNAGITGDIIGTTPNLSGRFTLRGNEIHAWIVENEKLIGKPYYDFHTYAILDDDSDMLYWQKDNFFQTDNSVGLTEVVAYKVIRFLNR